MNYFLDTNICLDLLDTRRPNASRAVQWYMEKKDNPRNRFCFFGDAITTVYNILTARNKVEARQVFAAIEALCEEIEPTYMIHQDFQSATYLFREKLLEDFEDLMMLSVAHRCKAEKIITEDKALLALGEFEGVDIGKVDLFVS